MEKSSMPLSVVDIYRDILPKTNCGDCGFATCLAFAGMVVSEKHALKKCPHLSPDTLKQYGKVLTDQYASGKWVKKDLAEEALKWAIERASSLDIQYLPRYTDRPVGIEKGETHDQANTGRL